MLDCAYGLDETPYAVACARLMEKTDRLLSTHPQLIFPVPKYGRGLELLQLFSRRLTGVPYFADALFLKNLAEQAAGGVWYRPGKIQAAVAPSIGQERGILFVSDPQLRTTAARTAVEQVLSRGGMAVMTGTVEKGPYSEKLLREGSMTLLRYPVHLNHGQFARLAGQNAFRQSFPYHSPALSAPREFPVEPAKG